MPNGNNTIFAVSYMKFACGRQESLYVILQNIFLIEQHKKKQQQEKCLNANNNNGCLLAFDMLSILPASLDYF